MTRRIGLDDRAIISTTDGTMDDDALWCPTCRKRIDLGEIAWHGFGNLLSDAYCSYCDSIVEPHEPWPTKR